jgi:hypothetical protein
VLELGQLNGIWELFGKLGFFGAGQRRGAHVSIPKIGSRGELLCFGGILGFHADLRRELIWRNFKLELFGVLLSDPRRCVEEGGPLCALEEFIVLLDEFCKIY